MAYVPGWNPIAVRNAAQKAAVQRAYLGRRPGFSGLGACSVKDPATGEIINLPNCGESVTVTPDEVVYTDLATGKSVYSEKTDWVKIGLTAAAGILLLGMIAKR